MSSVSEISYRLERLPTSFRHYQLLVLHGMGWFFQALALNIFPFVLTALSTDWTLPPSIVGLLASITILGVLLGSLLSGTLADYFGRRPTFIATFFVFTLFTILSAIAWNPTSLAIFRVGVGFGLGGEAIIAASLLTELAPVQKRGRFVTLLETFWVSGSAVAAVLAYLLIPSYGWRTALLAAGIPILYSLALWRFLLESPRWLASRNRIDKAVRIVSKLEQQVERSSGRALEPVPLSIPVNPATNPKVPFRELWSPKYRTRTLMLWIMWFGMSFGFYGIFTWLPTLLVNAGFTTVRSFFYTMLIFLTGIGGAISAAFLVERAGRKWSIGSYLLLSALAALLYGRSTSELQVLLWGSMMAFFNLGAWGMAYTYAAELYPTAARGTGSGSSSAFGRIGAILAPTITGITLAVLEVPGVFILNGAMFVMAALSVLFLGVETKGRLLD